MKSKGAVLLVDDEPTVLRANQRLLRWSGYEVEIAGTAQAASALLDADEGRFDVLVSDICMPEVDGMDLLRHLRAHNRDLPVVLLTGEPQLDTAIEAVELGAVQYLTKPVEAETLRRVVDRAVQLHRNGPIRRALRPNANGTSNHANGHSREDADELSVDFDSALARMWIAFQPVVSTSTQRLYGYEALLRSEEPRLPNVRLVIEAAEQLARIHDLGRAVRQRVAASLPQAPTDLVLFVNLHPLDLLDERLLAGDDPLGALASRVILEVTERASLDTIPGLRDRVQRLRRQGYRIAIDDLGAGYAGLSSFAELEPDVAKLDMSIVRDCHREMTKQRLIRSMTHLCNEMGVMVVAEGVESRAERDAVVDLGCHLVQGYHFGRPVPPFSQPIW